MLRDEKFTQNSHKAKHALLRNAVPNQKSYEQQNNITGHDRVDQVGYCFLYSGRMTFFSCIC